jgi:hypothetical protein
MSVLTSLDLLGAPRLPSKLIRDVRRAQVGQCDVIVLLTFRSPSLIAYSSFQSTDRSVTGTQDGQPTSQHK